MSVAIHVTVQLFVDHQYSLIHSLRLPQPFRHVVLKTGAHEYGFVHDDAQIHIGRKSRLFGRVLCKRCDNNSSTEHQNIG